MDDEKTPRPVAKTQAVQGFLVALIGWIVAMGWWRPTPAQIGATLTLVGAGIGLYGVFVLQQQVTPWRAGKPRKGQSLEEYLDELAELAWTGVEGVEFVDEEADFHDAFDAPHGVNAPHEQGG